MLNVPVEVKDTLREGRLKKNYRMVVLNDDGTEDFTIDNDTLVSESVSIDERMCSGDTIKFGLCEGSSLEFQYFLIDKGQYEANETYMRNDLVHSADTVWRSKTNDNIGNPLQEGDSWAEWAKPNITDRQVQVFCDVEYGGNTPYTIPMGFFTVKNCSRQASTGIIKVTAYNKLQSDYLDAKANQMLIDMFPSDRQLSVYDIRYFLLGDYKINEDRTAQGIWVNPDPSELQPISTWYSRIQDFQFNRLYGVKSPINACEFNVTSTDTVCSLHILSTFLPYSVGANCQMDARFGTLIELEKNIVNYIKKSIDDADLTVSGEETIDYLCQKYGFQRIVGLFDGRMDVGGWYSTVQWEYEEKHGLDHTVKGRIADLQMLVPSDYVGSLAWYAIVPSEFNKAMPPIYMTDPPFIDFNGSISENGVTNYRDYYNYYIDSELTETATEKVPYLTFSDGTRYELKFNDNTWAICAFQYNHIAPADEITWTPSTMPEFTLRELQTAVFETEAQFGKLDRATDLFSGVELNHSRLLPADTLYPSDSLYPYGSGESAFRSQYSKLWADEGNIHKWRYLIITYKGLDGEGNETDYTLQRTVNADGTDNYNCSDNWLFRNLVWTAEQIGAYADAMVAKMRDITWFPFEMWCAGLPYLETGDEIEIPLGDQTYTSYILQRQLKGIQNLQDTYINGTLDIF